MSEWKEIKGGEEFKFEKEGDTIEGELINVRRDVGDNKSMMYDIQTDSGLKAIWGSMVLDSKMRVIKIGQQIKIVYKGRKPSKRGSREYHEFEVFIKPSDDQPAITGAP